MRLAEARRVALWSAVTHSLIDAAREVGIDASDPAALYARAASVIIAGTAMRARWAATAPQVEPGARRSLARQISRQEAITALGTMPTGDTSVLTGTMRVVGMASSVSVGELMPFVTSALREVGWRPDPLAMYRLFDGCRRYDDAAPSERFARSKTTGPRLRMDRADAIQALFTRTASPRVTVLLTSAQELLGRVVRDTALLSAILAETQPIPGVLAGDPGTWRGALVAKALLGVGPSTDDVAVALTGDRLTGAAVALAAVLAMGSDAADTLRALLSGNAMVAPAAATAAQRLRGGRVTTAVS